MGWWHLQELRRVISGDGWWFLNQKPWESPDQPRKIMERLKWGVPSYWGLKVVGDMDKSTTVGQLGTWWLNPRIRFLVSFSRSKHLDFHWDLYGRNMAEIHRCPPCTSLPLRCKGWSSNLPHWPAPRKDAKNGLTTQQLPEMAAHNDHVILYNLYHFTSFHICP